MIKKIAWALGGISVAIAIGMVLRVDAGAYVEGFEPERFERWLAIWGAISGSYCLMRFVEWMDKSRRKSS